MTTFSYFSKFLQYCRRIVLEWLTKFMSFSKDGQLPLLLLQGDLINHGVPEKCGNPVQVHECM